MKKLILIFVGGSITLSLFVVFNYGNSFSNMFKSKQFSIYSKSLYQLHLDTKGLEISIFINDKEIIPESYGSNTDSSNHHYIGRNKIAINRFLQAGENDLRISFSQTEQYTSLNDEAKRRNARTAFASLILVEGILTTNKDALNGHNARHALTSPNIKSKALVNKLYRRFIPETISQKNEYSFTFNVDEQGFTPFTSEHCKLEKSASNIASAELTLNSYSALKIENKESYAVPNIFSVDSLIKEAELHVYALKEPDKMGILDINIECEIAPLLTAAGIQGDIIQQINGHHAEWHDTSFPLLSFQFDSAGIHQPK
ncbi:MAG: hypothetical protein ACJA0T_002093 [Colwellia sp.]|jgi:hypothetical protein